jgi:2,5-diketo-D-gluconate reductase A
MVISSPLAPLVGLGFYKVPSREVRVIFENAVKIGYRLFDTASFYENEEEIGNALKASGLRRSDIHLTSKAWLDELGREKIRVAFYRSLEKLGLEKLDCYMIHWPAPLRDLYVESFETLLELKAEGLISSVGVSNFHPEHLDKVHKSTGVFPDVHQVESHPFFQQNHLLSYSRERGILLQASSPLARGAVAQEESLRELAGTIGLSAAQIAIAWQVSRGVVPIPKASSALKLEENFRASRASLNEDILRKISDYDRGGRTGVDPNERN